MERKNLSKDDKHRSKRKKRHRNYSDGSSSGSGEWVEKKTPNTVTTSRDEWMSSGGVLKTFTKDDMKAKRQEKDKKHIDSYNPSTSSRELNPYWKDGGTGVPHTYEDFRKSKSFIKPVDEDNYYSRSSSHSKDTQENRRRKSLREDEGYAKSNNWKKRDEYSMQHETDVFQETLEKLKYDNKSESLAKPKSEDSLYLSDEKMNKLAAKIVKAEIMGDQKLVKELKDKLEAAREYRKQNPDAGKKGKEGVLLIKTSSTGSSRPVMEHNDHIRKKGKAKTHDSDGRIKYYANDDRYDLSRMFEHEKYESHHNDDIALAAAASKCKDPENLDELFVERIAKNKSAIKETTLQDQHAIRQAIKQEQTEEDCTYCIESKRMFKHLMISCGNKVYLALPSRESLVEGHCIITTTHHTPCVTAVDEDVWEEILSYRKMLTQFFNNQNKDVVFFETAMKLYAFPHMTIHCMPLPRDVGDMASIYFKKALLECETEWSMNKKVVELKGKNIRKGVPKGLPYFWVDFGMDPGFAHVIEDQNLFPRLFAQEVIAGMLDLDPQLWKYPKRQFGDEQRNKVLNFLKEWKPFEETFKSGV